MRKVFFTLICLSIFLPLQLSAQKKKKNAFVFGAEYKAAEDSIEKIAFEVINDPNENVRLDANFRLIKTLVKMMKMPHSFEYPFDSLKSLGLIKDERQTFRIFTWHYKGNDDSYRYYGVIQKNNPNKAEYYPFFDFSDKIESPADSALKNTRWYGVHYYSMLEHKVKGERVYTLLGWKGNSQKSTKKVIETLSFDKEGKPVFGQRAMIQNPIDLVKDADPVFKNRIIFEYNAEASMLLRYLPKEKMIIFDHLIPVNETAKGFYQAYVPDLSYDGLKFKGGKWIIKQNIPLKNPPSPLDKLYNDPTKK